MQLSAPLAVCVALSITALEVASACCVDGSGIDAGATVRSERMRMEAAWAALRGADWAAARDAFLERLAVDAGGAEALDGLGRALWWPGGSPGRGSSVAGRHTRHMYAVVTGSPRRT